ncbi:AAA family ATPase [Methanobrevibacter oralis]|uniref:AAA domain-containing protein n=1 Tax=Methanobrevibacter oralis TaxID=66851 RepID=A0A166AP99_METOA|nr:AAA family ATPase [Methanobrevibacter oralis]KZX12294.1 hypothetical protein MBORA_12710 [Methanobrevibacter oralis]
MENKINRFIVLPGLRGVGKTTILYQLYDYLIKEHNILPNQILYLSCEDLNSLTDCNILQTINIYLKDHHDATLRTLNKKKYSF